MLRQAARLHRLDGAVGHQEPHPQLAVALQGDADIAVKQPQRAVVARS
jgi:hypothetical protein